MRKNEIFERMKKALEVENLWIKHEFGLRTWIKRYRMCIYGHWGVNQTPQKASASSTPREKKKHTHTQTLHLDAISLPIQCKQTSIRAEWKVRTKVVKLSKEKIIQWKQFAFGYFSRFFHFRRLFLWWFWFSFGSVRERIGPSSLRTSARAHKYISFQTDLKTDETT